MKLRLMAPIIYTIIWSSEEYDNDSQKTVYWLDGYSASVDSAKNGTLIKKSQTRIICVRDSI